jgi:hypothetical protein
VQIYKKISNKATFFRFFLENTLKLLGLASGKREKFGLGKKKALIPYSIRAVG